jgi:hypothetical protein
MSQRKLNQPAAGRPRPPLTKLKELSPLDRSKVMEILRHHSYRDAEPLVAEVAGFPCSVDVLCRFFSWQNAQEDLELSNDMLRQMVSFARENLSGWPEEKIRATAAAFFTLRAMAKRDDKTFANMARMYLQSERCRITEQKLELDKMRLEQSSRRKLEVALDALGKAFKKKPEALKLYQQAMQMVEERNG